MRRLLLLRHAKSDSDDRTLDDHDRPLSPRGQRAAAALGAFIAQRGTTPTLALCSSARRTVETLQHVLSALQAPPEVSVERELYLAATDQQLARVRSLPDEHVEVLVVGHNPGTQSLALRLCGRGDPATLERLATKFPTGALAELHFRGAAWADLEPGQGTLETYRVPKDLV